MKRTCTMCHQQEDCLYGYVNSEPVCMYCWETMVDLKGGDYGNKNLVY